MPQIRALQRGGSSCSSATEAIYGERLASQRFPFPLYAGPTDVVGPISQTFLVPLFRKKHEEKNYLVHQMHEVYFQVFTKSYGHLETLTYHGPNTKNMCHFVNHDVFPELGIFIQ